MFQITWSNHKHNSCSFSFPFLTPKWSKFPARFSMSISSPFQCKYSKDTKTKMCFPGSNSARTVATRFIRAVAGLWSSPMARSSNFWMAAVIALTCWRGILVRWLGLCSTGVSTGRVLRKKPPKSAPRGRKSSKGPLWELHSKISWPRGIKSPKCVRPNVNKPSGKPKWFYFCLLFDFSRNIHSL